MSLWLYNIYTHLVDKCIFSQKDEITKVTIVSFVDK